MYGGSQSFGTAGTLTAGRATGGGGRALALGSTGAASSSKGAALASVRTGGGRTEGVTIVGTGFTAGAARRWSAHPPRPMPTSASTTQKATAATSGARSRRASGGITSPNGVAVGRLASSVARGIAWARARTDMGRCGPVTAPTWALAEVNSDIDLDLQSWPSLEAQVAAISDDIAYDNHDIDDGIRAGLLTLEQLLELPFLAEAWERISAKYRDAKHESLVRELVREQIGVMVNDVIDTTRKRLVDLAVENADDIRQAGAQIGGFSNDLAARERGLKAFMYANLYHHPAQQDAADTAQAIIADLFQAYASDPSLLPADWQSGVPTSEPQRSRHIADFLAGMTDRYAQNRHREIFGPGA